MPRSTEPGGKQRHASPPFAILVSPGAPSRRRAGGRKRCSCLGEDKEVDLRLSLWVPPAHPLTSAAKAWGEDIAKASNGTIKITVFPSEQLGKAFDHYDMARDDIADITYVNPGYQPGRFPVIAIGQMPFMFGDARKGTAALDSWYRKYAATEMKDTHFCFAFIHDPGALHSRKKIVLPQDLRGAKVRPAQSTIAELVTKLGGTNVQASAPEAREVLERGVADAITFPWGSLYLFGIDKVVKHHIDAPLYTTVFTFSINKDKYESMSPAQKKVMDDHCSTDWAVKIAGPWGDFESAGRDKMRADPTHESHQAHARSDGGVARDRRAAQGELGGGGEAGRRRSRRRARRAQRCNRQIRRGSMTAAEGRRAGMTGNAMDRFIDGIELAAAAFIGIVAVDIFVSVVLRYLFNTSIPDSYDFGRLLLGILIFWGIAATSYRGGHITVDLVWAAAGSHGKRMIDIFATLVLLFVVAVQTAMLFDKVRSTRADHVLTYDLHLPTWPFFAVAWAGDVSAVILIAVRTWRLIFHPEKLNSEPIAKAVE